MNFTWQLGRALERCINLEIVHKDLRTVTRPTEIPQNYNIYLQNCLHDWVLFPPPCLREEATFFYPQAVTAQPLRLPATGAVLSQTAQTLLFLSLLNSSLKIKALYLEPPYCIYSQQDAHYLNISKWVFLFLKKRWIDQVFSNSTFSDARGNAPCIFQVRFMW